MDLEPILDKLHETLEELGEPDGDASWYKDNSRHINDLIETARQIDQVFRNIKEVCERFDRLTLQTETRV